MLPVSRKNISSFTRKGKGAYQIRRYNLNQTCRTPLAQRRCCALKAFTSTGISAEVNAFKAQQRRWAKGVLQVWFKLYRRIWYADLPLRVKLEMFFRLTGNISYPLMIV